VKTIVGVSVVGLALTGIAIVAVLVTQKAPSSSGPRYATLYDAAALAPEQIPDLIRAGAKLESLGQDGHTPV
jgi:uncharacterized protein YbjT (DUF2867 family)